LQNTADILQQQQQQEWRRRWSADRKAKIYDDDDDDDARRGRCGGAKSLSQEAGREIVAEPARRS